MIKELSNSIIYNDFISKTILTNDEINILKMLLLKYSLVKISQEISMSDRNVSRIIKSLKQKYEIYRKFELTKLDIFKS